MHKSFHLKENVLSFYFFFTWLFMQVCFQMGFERGRELNMCPQNTSFGSSWNKPAEKQCDILSEILFVIQQSSFPQRHKKQKSLHWAVFVSLEQKCISFGKIIHSRNIVVHKEFLITHTHRGILGIDWMSPSCTNKQECVISAFVCVLSGQLPVGGEVSLRSAQDVFIEARWEVSFMSPTTCRVLNSFISEFYNKLQEKPNSLSHPCCASEQSKYPAVRSSEKHSSDLWDRCSHDAPVIVRSLSGW